MSDTDLKNLVDMGFTEAKCHKALQLNKNNMQEALEWLLVHGHEPEPEATEEKTSGPTLKLSSDNAPSGQEAPAMSSEVVDLHANSLKCDDCGALLKDEDFATLHAHKTGHVNFSQSTEAIKPKTKEEIEEQKKRLHEKLIKLRHEKQEKEKQDQIEQEKSRRKEGRQLGEIKQKFHEDELKRIAEEKRREKLADIAHKQKVREQIARDREAYKTKHQAGEGSSAPVAVVSPPTQPQTCNEKKEYSECRIQVRLTDGKTLVHSFRPSEQLAAVRLWIEMNRTDAAGGFNLMQTFPRKIYSNDDMMRTLLDLGLVPASSLVITKI